MGYKNGPDMALAHHPFARYMKLRNSPSGHGQHVEFTLQKQKPLLEKQLRCTVNWENWDLFFVATMGILQEPLDGWCSKFVGPCFKKCL